MLGVIDITGSPSAKHVNWRTAAPMTKKTKKSKIAIKEAKKAAKKAKKLDAQVDRSDIPLKPSFSS
jgi:hypothetical protein